MSLHDSPSAYASRKLGHVLFILMTQPGTLRDRLRWVERCGDLAAVNALDFPEEMRGDWHRLMGALYPREGAIAAVQAEAFSGEFIDEDTRTPAEIEKDRLEEWMIAFRAFYAEFQTHAPEGLREKRQKGMLT